MRSRYFLYVSPREPSMTPGQRVLCACVGAVCLFVGFFACVFLGNAQLDRALTENAALRQENADLRVAAGLPEATPEPLARN